MEIDKDKLKNFLTSIKNKTNITATELIEKDFYLNILLSKLNFEEYVFKGGTCLAKAYLDYFRFSEDLDFTFINQKLWEGKSTKSIKKVCKEKIDAFGEQLKKVGFDFKFDKSDRNFVEIGNNNKLVTFKVYYDSVLTGKPSFIKIQINFLEKIIFTPQTRELNPLIKLNQFTKEDQIYFKEFLDFYKTITMKVYDLKEIVTEKFRSILTRKAIKSRDAIDLLFIYQKFKIKPQNLLKETKEKLLYSINSYEKYKDNLILARDKLQILEFQYSEVRPLVIKPFNKDDFDKYVEELKPLWRYKIESDGKKDGESGCKLRVWDSRGRSSNWMQSVPDFLPSAVEANARGGSFFDMEGTTVYYNLKKDSVDPKFLLTPEARKFVVDSIENK
jgi:predicted nucleotidyltransferase component of viral defense system